MRLSRVPDFFVVGAAKCGTSSLHDWLQQHPDIFMPDNEPHQFGQDLGLRPAPRPWSKYEHLFEGAEPGQLLGEKDPTYLFSETAAEEIHAVRPDAKIIILLRPHVDFLRSLHSQCCYAGLETRADFESALNAEPERAARRDALSHQSPEAARSIHPTLLYRRVAQFSTQIKRYHQVFSPDQVRILLLEDLKHDPQGVYRDLLAFLGVDPEFVPEFRRVNEHRNVRSLIIQRLVRRPPWLLNRLGKALLHSRLRNRMWRLLVSVADHWNVREGASRSPLAPAFERQLRAEFAEDVAELGRLLNRDLSHWTQRPATVDSAETSSA